jgi:hypothetical protein
VRFRFWAMRVLHWPSLRAMYRGLRKIDGRATQPVINGLPTSCHGYICRPCIGAYACVNGLHDNLSSTQASIHTQGVDIACMHKRTSFEIDPPMG